MSEPRNSLQHVNDVMSRVHEGFVAWARRFVHEAGLEDVEVYGRFPAEGSVRSYVVCFPYRLGPSPKLVDTTKGVSLLRFRRAHDDQEMFIPMAWGDLGKAMSECMEELYPQPDPGERRRGQRVRPMGLAELPKPLSEWYRAREAEQTPEEDPWVTRSGADTMIRAPALWWQPAFHLTTYYIVLANDGGRGTSARTSTGPPLALPSLSVIASAVHLEKALYIDVPPLPHSPLLDSLVDAMGQSLGGARQENLQEIMGRLNRTDTLCVGVVPVQDLTNHEFATLMTALNRPLQPSLNIMLRLPLAAVPVLSPSVSFGALGLAETPS